MNTTNKENKMVEVTEEDYTQIVCVSSTLS
jgi:hypothetical protein